MDAKWIYYPGDFERMLFCREMPLRQERDVNIPPFWRMDAPYSLVKFAKKFTLTNDCEITIKADGQFNVELDEPGKYVYGASDLLRLSAGLHTLCILVYNPVSLPSLFVSSAEFVSDSTWNCTCQDSIWLNAAQYEGSAECPPSTFHLSERAVSNVSQIRHNGKTLCDFGREMSAYLQIEACDSANVTIYYGESADEAADWAACEQIQRMQLHAGINKTERYKAFRYISVGLTSEEPQVNIYSAKTEKTSMVNYGEHENKLTHSSDCVFIKNITAIESFLDITSRASFASSDKLLNKIFSVSEHTLHLTSREFFIDGIKRDRWVWAGDAYQSNLMNYYSFFDKGLVCRTAYALAGKQPICCHLNTITDYSLYWLKGIRDYYQYSGDAAFVQEIFPLFDAITMFVVGRLDDRGYLFKRPEDWVFVDWSENLNNEGIVSFIQILLCDALRACGEVYSLCGKTQQGDKFFVRADKLKNSIIQDFWNDERGGFIYSDRCNKIFRQPNVMAVLTKIAGEEREERILHNVLLSSETPSITTPYMRFYELAALCEKGQHKKVYAEMITYWGGMLDNGATSFWELYKPTDNGSENYSMYGRKYGKSLCHSWGASPLYLLGHYFAGLKPLLPGYKIFELRPVVNLFDYEYTLPLPKGEVKLKVCGDKVSAISSVDGGVLVLGEQRVELKKDILVCLTKVVSANIKRL